MKLVRSHESACDNIRTFNLELEKHPELAERLGLAHAFYVLDEASPEPLFGFSKFVGYEKMTAPYYLSHYNELDGRNTEWALKDWFEELPQGSAVYTTLLAKLTVWLAKFGKRPRVGAEQSVRLMVLRSTYRENDAPEATDDELVALLIAVVKRLPPAGKRAVRNAI